jgi:DNA replication protein DnaC
MTSLTDQLHYLKLAHLAEHHVALAKEAAAAPWSHLEFLQRLLDGECAVRQQRAVERRVRAARFPVIKTLDQFRWDWPKKSTNPRCSTSSASASSRKRQM